MVSRALLQIFVAFFRSHIPSALTSAGEQEQVEKRREAKRLKRQKEKEKKIADEPRRQEVAEQKRFLELSDRDKVANKVWSNFKLYRDYVERETGESLRTIFVHNEAIAFSVLITALILCTTSS